MRYTLLGCSGLKPLVPQPGREWGPPEIAGALAWPAAPAGCDFALRLKVAGEADARRQ